MLRNAALVECKARMEVLDELRKSAKQRGYPVGKLTGKAMGRALPAGANTASFPLNGARRVDISMQRTPELLPLQHTGDKWIQSDDHRDNQFRIHLRFWLRGLSVAMPSIDIARLNEVFVASTFTMVLLFLRAGQKGRDRQLAFLPLPLV
jgi:hypothetical protein